MGKDTRLVQCIFPWEGHANKKFDAWVISNIRSLLLTIQLKFLVVHNVTPYYFICT